MKDPLVFPIAARVTRAPAAPGTAWMMTLTLTLGPFVTGTAPAWADVAAMVVAEVRREWEQHNAPATSQTPA